MIPYREYSQDIEICRKIQKEHGKSYYFATKLFPKDIREATHILYSFLRVPDEIVDNPNTTDVNEVKQQLENWQAEWELSKSKGTTNPVLRATAFLFKKYRIPHEYADKFLDSMIQDTVKSRYENYKELENYMYGSAATVGLMMTYIVGFKSPEALPYAEKLAYAMQLTNFLRDIDEDYIKRNRIYMPLDELSKFNLHEKDISNQNYDEDFTNFMKWQIARARKLYEEGNSGIRLLSKKGRFPVRLGSALYEAILDKIEESNYNIFNKRVKTSFAEKCLITIKKTIK